MKRVLAFLFFALLYTAQASAQIPVPQGCNAPNVPSGLDATGHFTCRQLAFPFDLSFAGIFGLPTVSFTQAEVNLGNITLILGTDPGYKTDYTVEITTPEDTTPFMIGVIQKIDTGSGQTVLTIAVFRSQGGGIYDQWNIKVIGGPTFSIPASGALAVDSTDSFALPAAGTTLSLTVDTGKLFTAGSQVYMQALSDFTTSLTGVVENYNSSTGAMTLYVTNSSGTGLTYQLWTVALTGNLAPFVPILNFSSTSLTFGSGAGQIAQGSVVTMTTGSGALFNNSHVVVSSSTDSTQYFRGIAQYSGTSITIYITDASGSGTIASWTLFAQDGPPINASEIAVSKTSATIGAGTFTFTIQSGQFFPINAPVLITSLASTTNTMLGQVAAYSGTSLVVVVTSNGVYGSGTFTAWSIFVSPGPVQTLPQFSIQGLSVRQSSTPSTAFVVSAGAIADSTGTQNLYLLSDTTLTLGNANSIAFALQSGTIASSNGTITGSSTTFTSNFSTAATITDINNSLAAQGLSSVGYPSVMVVDTGSGSVTSNVMSVSSNTLAATFAASNKSAGTTFYRGANASGQKPNANGTMNWALCIGFNPASGTSLFASSFTVSGTPDLPSGVTLFRCFEVLTLNYLGQNNLIASSHTPIFGQPRPHYLTPSVAYSATITPTSLGQNVTGNASGVFTFLSAHDLVTGQSVLPVAGTGNPGTPTSIGSNSTNSNVSSLIVTTTAAIVANNLVVCGIGIKGNSNPTVNTVSDGTNTYTRAKSVSSSNGTKDTIELWYKENASAVASNASLTVSLTGTLGTTASLAVGCVQVSGMVTSGSLDSAAAQSGVSSSSTGITVTTGTLAQSAEIVFGAIEMGGFNGKTYTESSGFTTLFNALNGANNGALSLAYDTVAATTAVSYAPTISGAVGIGQVAVPFKIAVNPPSGLTANQPYYVNAPTAYTLSLFNSYANAVANISPVVPSTDVGWSLNYLAATNEFNSGLVNNGTAAGAVAGTTGTTNMAFDFNLLYALANTYGIFQIAIDGLTDSGGTIRHTWILSVFPTFASTTLVQLGNTGLKDTTSGNNPGTWAQQGTNAIKIQVLIWG